MMTFTALPARLGACAAAGAVIAASAVTAAVILIVPMNLSASINCPQKARGQSCCESNHYSALDWRVTSAYFVELFAIVPAGGTSAAQLLSTRIRHALVLWAALGQAEQL